MENLVVYSRQGCHLCEELIEQLLPMIRGQFELEVRDIDTKPDWHERFWEDIPVVEYQGEERRRGELEELVLRVETGESAPDGTFDGFVERLSAAFKQRLGIGVVVEAAEAGSLPRYELKANRFVPQD